KERNLPVAARRCREQLVLSHRPIIRLPISRPIIRLPTGNSTSAGRAVTFLALAAGTILWNASDVYLFTDGWHSDAFRRMVGLGIIVEGVLTAFGVAIQQPGQGRSS